LKTEKEFIFQFELPIHAKNPVVGAIDLFIGQAKTEIGLFENIGLHSKDIEKGIIISVPASVVDCPKALCRTGIIG